MRMSELGKIAKISIGKSGKAKRYDGVRLVRITGIEEYNTLGSELVSPENPKSGMLTDGDILFPRTGTSMIPHLYRAEDGQACAASFLYSIRSQGEAAPENIYYQLCSPRFQNWLAKNRSDRNITTEILEKYPYCMEPELPIDLLMSSEKMVRLQKVLILQKERRFENVLHRMFVDDPDTSIGEICRKVKSAAPASKGQTPVMDGNGICGYSSKKGYGKDVVGIQKHGRSANLYIIPAGNMGAPSLECVEPLVDIQELFYILKAVNLPEYIHQGPVPHLYFEDIKGIPCRLVEDNISLVENLEKQLGLEKEKLRMMELRHRMLLEQCFPS